MIFHITIIMNTTTHNTVDLKKKKGRKHNQDKNKTKLIGEMLKMQIFKNFWKYAYRVFNHFWLTLPELKESDEAIL